MSEDKHFLKELLFIADIIKEIGVGVMEIYLEDFSYEIKEDKSELTKADLLSEKLLMEKLSENFPDYGIISEETENDPSVYTKNKVFVIDPLDGTKDFVQKTGEFSIMIALMENRKPIMGIVYIPPLKKMYLAQKGMGAYIIEDDELREIKVSDIKTLNESTLVRSRNHFSEIDEKISKELNINNFIKMGSVGVKFGAIAEGKAEFCYYTTDKMGIWDDAASHIILKEAGGEVFDINGAEPEYDFEGRKMKYGFIGTNGKIDKNLILNTIKRNL